MHRLVPFPSSSPFLTTTTTTYIPAHGADPMPFLYMNIKQLQRVCDATLFGKAVGFKSILRVSR